MAKAKAPPLRQQIPTNEDLHATHGVDFRNTAHWRIFRIMAEFIDGFQFLYDLKKEVSIYGSTRTPEGSRWYNEARKLGAMLGKAKFTVITGGGPGIMEAGNRGAFESGAESVGLNIQLPYEQRTNPYVKKGLGFHYFFTRKVMLSASSQAYIFFPGGFGTIDELTELVELIQTEKMQRVPIVLVGKEHWEGYFAWVRKVMLEGEHPLIEKKDLDIVQIVDSAEEAFAIVKKTKERPYF
ncbi:MAG: TIGR00730 family Rossman fold protein [Candidatus Uhrbacteria bacterium]